MRAQAANELRDRILTGRLQPGDRLDLDELTAEFGISRTPVREALLELSYEGLVAITPRSGMAVVGITPQDAVDNFAVLAALAGKAAELATGRITPAEMAELHKLAAAIDRSDDVVAANRRFHRALNQATRSPRLLTYLRQAVRVVPGNYFELFPEQAERSRHEHAALLEAMARGDGAVGTLDHGGPRVDRRRGSGRLARGDRARGAGGVAPVLIPRRAGPHSERRSDSNSRSRLARSSGVVNDRSSALSAKSSAASTARSSWMLTTRLVSSTAPLGSRAMRWAQAIACVAAPRRRDRRG